MKYIFAVLIFFTSTASAQVIIRNVKVYTSANEKPLNNASILINEGKIVRVGLRVRAPKNSRIIDGAGMVAVPGFWNCHVHLIQPKWKNAAGQDKETLQNNLKDMLSRWGFTYAFDIAQFDAADISFIKRSLNSGNIIGPTIFSVGVPFTSKSPIYIRPLVLPELNSRKDVEAHINRQIEGGANAIKIWSASPTRNGVEVLADSLVAAATALAHKKGIKVFAHPTNLVGATKAVDNGVDILAHVAPEDGRTWDSTLLRKLVDKKTALIPTLKLFKWELARMGITDSSHSLITTAIQQAADFANAGGTILFGTDVGYVTDYDPTEEFVMMQKAGMTFRQILASLTSSPAAAFGFADKTGKVEQGYTADLVLLSADPADDVRNFTKTRYVIHNGEIIYAPGPAHKSQ